MRYAIRQAKRGRKRKQKEKKRKRTNVVGGGCSHLICWSNMLVIQVLNPTILLGP